MLKGPGIHPTAMVILTGIPTATAMEILTGTPTATAMEMATETDRF